jgi:hypothetical protein
MRTMESYRVNTSDNNDQSWAITQVAVTGDELLQKAHDVSQSIEERVRKVLREGDTSQQAN